jgi:hypothetical protein
VGRGFWIAGRFASAMCLARGFEVARRGVRDRPEKAWSRRESGNGKTMECQSGKREMASQQD